MHEVYSNQFIKVFQTDDGATVVVYADAEYIVTQKHCDLYTAAAKINCHTHAEAKDFARNMSEDRAGKLNMMFP